MTYNEHSGWDMLPEVLCSMLCEEKKPFARPFSQSPHMLSSVSELLEVPNVGRHQIYRETSLNWNHQWFIDEGLRKAVHVISETIWQAGIYRSLPQRLVSELQENRHRLQQSSACLEMIGPSQTRPTHKLACNAMMSRPLTNTRESLVHSVAHSNG